MQRWSQVDDMGVYAPGAARCLACTCVGAAAGGLQLQGQGLQGQHVGGAACPVMFCLSLYRLPCCFAIPTSAWKRFRTNQANAVSFHGMFKLGLWHIALSEASA